VKAAQSISAVLCTLLLGLAAAAQTVVDGRVLDASSQAPLQGAAVYFQGTYTGVATDSLGRFHLESSDPAATVLTAELLGYGSQSFAVVPGCRSTLTFQLGMAARELQAARVKPDNRYMRRLLRKIDENRERHDPEARPGYSCDVYGKNRLDLANAADYLDNRLVRKHLGFVLDYIDEEDDGRLPALLSESYGRRYHVRQPPLDREVISASRIAGFNPETPLLQFTGAMHLKTNFYQRYINAFGLEIPSPMMTRGTVFYDYYLIDSLAVDGRKTYHLRFHPKKLVSTPVFDGEMYIDATDYALRSLRAVLHESPNINWIGSLAISVENRPDSAGVWFYRNDRLQADLSVTPQDSTSVLALRVLRERDYRNPVNEVPSGWEETGEEVVVLPEARHCDEQKWQEIRPERLTRKEEGVYEMVDRVQSTRAYRNMYSLANTLATGYYEMKYLGIGRIENLLSYGPEEGFKPRIGLRTTKGLSRRFRAMGSLGYGTRDHSFKFDAKTEYMFSNLPTRRLYAEVKHDILQLGKGMNGIGIENDLFSSFLNKTDERKFGLVDYVAAGYEHEWKPGLTNTLAVDGIRFHNGTSVPLIRQDGTPVPFISANRVRLSTRLSWKETVTRGAFEKQSLDTKYPVVTADIIGGIRGITPMDSDFLRTELSVDWRFNIPPLGRSKIYLNAGAIFGDVPFPLLKIHSGNDTWFYQRQGFACMRVYEFASDRWVTGFWEHNFRGLLLGKIPLIKRLGLEEITEARFAWGPVSAANQGEAAILRLPAGMTSLEKPYAEAGVGISNILRLIRVDFIWRLTHREAAGGLPAPDRFTVNVGFDVKF